MLPDMSDALDEWAQGVMLKTVTETTVDFMKTIVAVSAPIMAVIQPADAEKLQVDQIDSSLEYIQIHSVAPMAIGQFIECDGRDFKLVPFRKGYQQYGYTEAVGEETKLRLLGYTFGFSNNPSSRGFSDKFDYARVGGYFARKVI